MTKTSGMIALHFDRNLEYFRALFPEGPEFVVGDYFDMRCLLINEMKGCKLSSPRRALLLIMHMYFHYD